MKSIGMSRSWYWWLAVVVALVSLPWLGCGSDDEPSGPGGGGGGGTNNLTIVAGAYDIEIAQWTCGMTDTVRQNMSDVFCSNEVINELELDNFTIPCPIVVDGDSLRLLCTANVTLFPGCTAQVRVNIRGTKSGNDLMVMGDVKLLSDSPPSCSGIPSCAGLSIELTYTGPAPSGCQYADVNEMDLNLDSGPFAGQRSFFASGFSSMGSAGISFVMNGNWGDILGMRGDVDPASGVLPIGGGQYIQVSVSTPEIDPKTLPQSVGVQVLSKPAQTAGGGPVALMSYQEYRTTPFHNYLASGGTGSITIEELSSQHIAGRMDVTFTSSTSGTRRVRGGFFVLNSPIFSTATTDTPGDLSVVRMLWRGIRNAAR